MNIILLSEKKNVETENPRSTQDKAVLSITYPYLILTYNTYSGFVLLVTIGALILMHYYFNQCIVFVVF